VDLSEVLHEETRPQEGIGHLERPQAALDPPVGDQGIALDAEHREVDEVLRSNPDRRGGGVEHPIGRNARREHEEEPIGSLERAAPGLGPFEIEADVFEIVAAHRLVGSLARFVGISIAFEALAYCGYVPDAGTNEDIVPSTERFDDGRPYGARRARHKYSRLGHRP
jgi:hypothetical protein